MISGGDGNDNDGVCSSVMSEMILFLNTLF